MCACVFVFVCVCSFLHVGLHCKQTREGFTVFCIHFHAGITTLECVTVSVCVCVCVCVCVFVRACE